MLVQWRGTNGKREKPIRGKDSVTEERRRRVKARENERERMHKCMYESISMRRRVSASDGVHNHVRMYVYMYVWLYVCMVVWLYGCIYIYIYITSIYIYSK